MEGGTRHLRGRNGLQTHSSRDIAATSHLHIGEHLQKGNIAVKLKFKIIFEGTYAPGLVGLERSTILNFMLSDGDKESIGLHLACEG